MKREYDVIRVRKGRMPQEIRTELDGLIAAFKKQKKYTITESKETLIVWETVEE